MRTARIALLLLFSLTGFAQTTKKETNFPTQDEIQLVVSQAERAFLQYEQSITLEEGIPSMQANKDGIQQDRQLVNGSKRLTSGLKKKPEAFHGLGGLLLLSFLDDASRNAALCGSSTFADIASALISEKGLNPAKAQEFMHIGQACQDASVQLYTVSENVHALLVREMESQQTVNEQAMEALNQCTAAFKNMKKPSSTSPK